MVEDRAQLDSAAQRGSMITTQPSHVQEMKQCAAARRVIAAAHTCGRLRAKRALGRDGIQLRERGDARRLVGVRGHLIGTTGRDQRTTRIRDPVALIERRHDAPRIRCGWARGQREDRSVERRTPALETGRCRRGVGWHRALAARDLAGAERRDRVIDRFGDQLGAPARERLGGGP